MKFSSKDFNFFDKYNKTRQYALRRIELMVVFSLFILFISICGIVVSYTVKLKMQAIQFEIDSIVMFLENRDTVEGIEKNLLLNERLNEITDYNKAAERLNDSILKTPAINTYLIQSITSNITEGTSIVNMSATLGGIELLGKSGSEMSIAQFQHNMSRLGYVDDVFVTNITKDGTDCNFAMSIQMKEVASIENIEIE